MKNLYITIAFLLFSAIYASELAVTDTGKVVILNTDGTWKYADKNSTNKIDSNKTATKIETNKEIFSKPNKSTFLLKSSVNKSAYWINTDKWSFKKSPKAEETEYALKLKGRDLYAMTVTEEIEIKVEELAKVAVENAKEVAKDLKVVKKEYRVVNGKKVIFMQMQGSMRSIKFTYLGYYYSDKSGSTQLVAYTATALVPKYKKEIFNLLNGFTSRQ